MNRSAFRAEARRLLLGTDLTTEYVCLPLGAGVPFRIVLTDRGGGAPRELSHHLFLGYRPLLIGIPVDASSGDPPGEACLTLGPAYAGGARWRGFPTCPDAVARLHLRRGPSLDAGGGRVQLYTGVHGWHRLLRPHQRLARGILGRLEGRRRPRRDNVDLPGNLHDQVRIAYAVPRSIEVAGVGTPERGNLFPTDLHGPVGASGYVVSLRRGGHAGDQVERRGGLALSRVPAACARAVYALGPNHVRPLRRLDPDTLDGAPSPSIGAPLPRDVVRVRELETGAPIEVGVHRLFPARVIAGGDRSGDPDGTLAHVHVTAMTWAERQGIRPPVVAR